METIYDGITIKYSENNSRFEFELRGRSRSAESLTKAKEAIDKPVADVKKATFEPIEAYKMGYEGMHERVRITSIAENSYGAQYAWVSDSKKNRSKERADQLFPLTPKNDVLIVEIADLRQQIEALKEKKLMAIRKLKPIEIPQD